MASCERFVSAAAADMLGIPRPAVIGLAHLGTRSGVVGGAQRRITLLLGSSLIAQFPGEADQHLAEALTRCRRINMIDTEPDILLALARLHGDLSYALEALAIADRCEYRLVQADCHSVLARLVPERALYHAQKAHDYAWCDGPSFCYKPALDEADALLAAAAVGI